MKALLIFGILVVLAIGGSVAYNVLHKPAEVAQIQSSQAPSVAPEARQRQGSFGNVDAVHHGSGQAVVYRTSSGPVLRFENFSVTPGPDVYVYLSKNPKLAEDKKPGEFVSLGKLQANSGNQTYTLPNDYQDYTGVLIWCRAFSQAFSTAVLAPV